MPWCEECSKFYNPNSVGEAGECPTCGRRLERPEPAADVIDEAARVPWHFWLLLAALTLYLGWRLIQGVDVLFGWIF